MLRHTRLDQMYDRESCLVLVGTLQTLGQQAEPVRHQHGLPVYRVWQVAWLNNPQYQPQYRALHIRQLLLLL
jgi:hypothetical protein